MGVYDDGLSVKYQLTASAYCRKILKKVCFGGIYGDWGKCEG